MHKTRPADLIGLAEAARLIPSRKPGRKVCTTTICRWILRGKLQGWRIGNGPWLVSRAELLDLIQPASRLQPEAATYRQRMREIAEAEEVLGEAGYRLLT